MKNPNLDGKLDPIKPALSHIGLYLSLAAYTAIGAKVSPLYSFFVISIWRNVAARKSRNLPCILKCDQIPNMYRVRNSISFLARCYLVGQALRSEL